MADDVSARTEDLIGVRSRIHWSPLFAGAVVAVAVYLLLTLLGAAIGLSVGGDVRGNDLTTGAAIWAILSMMLSLFLGGWLTSQMMVGENRNEAVAYGVILWGLVFAMLLWMLGSGVSAGFNAMVGMANMSRAVEDTPSKDWEDAARRAGVEQQQIDNWKEGVKNAPAEARTAIENPETRRQASSATWWTFLGTLLSMFSAIGGAVVGAGPTLRLFSKPRPQVVVHDERRRVVT